MALFLVSIATVGFAFADSWKILIACMCLAPFGRDGTNPIAQSLLAEWVPIAYRGRLIVGGHLIFNVGRFAVTILWLFYPPRETWVRFFLASSALPICTTLYLALFGMRYESPRWLALAGRHTVLQANLCLAAQSCASPLGEECCDPANLELDGQHGSSALSSDDGKPQKTMSDDGNSFGLKAIFVSRVFVDARMVGMKTTISLFGICFFCISYSSWGLFIWTIDLLKAIEAHDAITAVLVASPLAKIFGNIVLVCPGLSSSPIDIFGRLLIFRIGMLGFSVFLFALCYCGSSSVLITSVIFMALMCEEWVWTVGTTCMTEAFPTNSRNIASAYVLTCASAGGILANSISLWLLHQWRYLPVVVMASLLLVGFATSWALPDDRKDKPLIDTCKKQQDASYNTLS
jgi:MFS family permease